MTGQNSGGRRKSIIIDQVTWALPRSHLERQYGQGMLRLKGLLEGDPPADRTQKVEGTCQADSDPCGCRTEIKGGLAQATICVD